MQDHKYDPISTTIPKDEDDAVANTPTKTSVTHPHHGELKDEEDLLLYETRTTTKASKSKPASYKVVRIFTLGLVMAVVATLLVLCTYMCITTECMSRNYRDLCSEGFCYEIAVDKFQDSDGDGIGDFDGVKQSLKFLREIGIQTVIIPLSSLKTTAAHHDEMSFVSMAKEGIKIGISTIMRLDDAPNAANLELLNKINSTISGFIATRDSPYFSDNNTWTQDIKCYTIISSPAEINMPKNNCHGTFYESKDVYDLSTEVVLTLKDSNVTNSSVNVISLRSMDSSVPNRDEKFLASLVFSSLTNGAISIKAWDELGVTPNGNYSSALDSNNTFQTNVFALMKNIKNNRLHSPKIGRDCVIEYVPTDPSVKAISKKCNESGIDEGFLAVYNSGDKETVVNVSSVLNNPNPIASMKILLQARPENSQTLYPTEALTLPAKSTVLIYVKYKPIVQA